ncbi:IQ and AAA domain-containing protein 1-like [Vanessa cardui]|uniref:IQ and AAA domain-containing protein 1-like n=1 Tax=Vanessa cardui TaxID=171605 RepID=UPI001F1362C2|nr:IQ and AAA domain-containing protein 1-like [Vanessa cardui]
MPCDYYFKKWKCTLVNLTKIVELDLEYQETKIHDKQICDAIQRLAGMLGSYILCYNDALDCLQHNLQVQKTEFIADVVEKIVTRILELKHQLTKLEGTQFQFLTNGLIERKLTPFDAEFFNIPSKYERPEVIKLAIEAAFRRVEELKRAETESHDNSENEQNPRDCLSENVNWWDENETINANEHKGINVTKVYEVEEKLSAETLKRREIIALIQTHERTRQVVRINTQQKQKRELWEKELKGILKPQAPFDLRERSAKMIQRVLRYYFVLKRKKIRECKRDELLHIKFCDKLNTEQSELDKQVDPEYYKLYEKCVQQREINCSEYKQNYLKKSGGAIAEDFRDYIRDWFQKWYKEANFFNDIPKENQGGPILIFKEEMPSPLEWLDDYKEYLETKKANKNKTTLQLKWEKEAGKEEEMMLKREELKKKKSEAALLKKMMKNPTLHPGYHYPMSKKTNNILTAIQNYYDHWSNIDDGEAIEAKEKFIQNIDEEHLCMETKLKICNSIITDMMEELKLLRKSLKLEYERNEEEMPNPKKEKTKRKKKERKIKGIIRDDLQDILTDLAKKGYLKEYPKMNFENFIGDVNYAGADLRCELLSTAPFGGEIRAVWWDRCREVIHGFRRILLVGPRESGKTTLVHIMATVNDAALYELDPFKIEVENTNSEYLKELISSVVSCAKITQPSIIHIRYVERLFYTKVPKEEAYKNFGLIKKFFVRKLFKAIDKQDNITIIGSCTEPWMTKSKQMIKTFNYVLPLPETNYSTVYLILRNWALTNRTVPHNLDFQSLARVLRGYPFGHIVKKLDNFLTAERIVHIAAYGLNSRDVYNFFLEDGNDNIINYEKYLKWYNDKTHWGQLEKKCLNERREFKILVEKWNEKI